MTTIYLVRHAQAEGNLYRRFHGHFNTTLTATGQQQLPYLSRRVADIPLSAVYSSDLTRARRTAEAIAAPKGLFVQTDARSVSGRQVSGIMYLSANWSSSSRNSTR